MRRHAGFGHIVHLPRADLDLDPLAVPARHRGVNGSVTVGLGLTDVILEPPRHGPPAPVNGPENTVAILFAGRDNAEPVDIRQTRKGLVLFLHLAPNGIGLLGPPEDFRFYSGLLKLYPHVTGNPLDYVPCLPLEGDETANDAGAALGIEHTKCEILQFLTHPLHPHAPGQRGIDIHGFARLLDLLVRPHRLDGAHVMQPVSQLDEDDAQILRHRHEQFAEVFRLFGLGRIQLQVCQLGDAVDEGGDLRTENRLHLSIGCFGVLYGVVQQGCDDRRVVKLLFGKNRSDGNRMREIRLAGVAKLPLVHLAAIIEGRADKRFVGFRVVGLNQRDQIVSSNFGAAHAIRL